MENKSCKTIMTPTIIFTSKKITRYHRCMGADPTLKTYNYPLYGFKTENWPSSLVEGPINLAI